jgi:hypothetical protein
LAVGWVVGCLFVLFMLLLSLMALKISVTESHAGSVAMGTWVHSFGGWVHPLGTRIQWCKSVRFNLFKLVVNPGWLLMGSRTNKSTVTESQMMWTSVGMRLEGIFVCNWLESVPRDEVTLGWC